MRERGLKCICGLRLLKSSIVASHAGAWIEIYRAISPHTPMAVAPHAGAWIEMVLSPLIAASSVVAPHAGAWIEMLS